MRGRTLLAGLVLAVLLSGCGTASVPRESVPPPSPSAAPRQQSPPAPVPTPPAAPSEGRDSELRYHTTSSYDLEIGIRRTTLDAQGRCLSVYFEVPVFEEATAGYRKINAFFEELTERFIRGDSSRSTEGSGLGLSIAKSLVQVHGGSFEILMDGDLFKVLLAFPEYNESPADDTGAR